MQKVKMFITFVWHIIGGLHENYRIVDCDIYISNDSLTTMLNNLVYKLGRFWSWHHFPNNCANLKS